MNDTVSLTYQQTSNKKLKKNFGIIVNNSKISGTVNNDLFNEQLLNFYKALEKFDNNKGTKFSTFLHTYLKSRRSNYIRDNFNNDEIELKKEFLEQIPDNTDIEGGFIKQEKSNEIMNEIENLDKKGKYILEQRIFNESTFKEISQKLNCSSQNIRQIYYNRVKKIRQRVDD